MGCRMTGLDRLRRPRRDSSGSARPTAANRLVPATAGFVVFARLGARVVSIDQDSSGDLWVGTLGNGLFRIHGRETVRFGKDKGFTPLVRIRRLR